MPSKALPLLLKLLSVHKAKPVLVLPALKTITNLARPSCNQGLLVAAVAPLADLMQVRHM